MQDNDTISDPASGSRVRPLEHRSMDRFKKRIFRLVPVGHRRGCEAAIVSVGLRFLVFVRDGDGLLSMLECRSRFLFPRMDPICRV